MKLGKSGQLPRIRLAICVTFHYMEDRLKYLAALSSHFRSLAESVVVTIVTNSESTGQQQAIRDIFRREGIDAGIFTPRGLGHPYLLPWSHFAVMRDRIQDESITHFLYLEDDLLCTQENVNYLLEAREMLRGIDLIPGIFRVEQHPVDQNWYSVDQPARVDVARCPKHSIVADDRFAFINLPNPYQGMYFLERELMREHLNGESSSPDYGNTANWGVRELASQGLMLWKIPAGFVSRVVVPVDLDEKQIVPCCLVHHLANNYVLKKESPYGKIRLRDVFF